MAFAAGTGRRRTFDGLPAFHALLEGPGPASASPLDRLVDADVDRAHREARALNGWSCLLESLDLKPKFMNDAEACRELLRMERARGLDWEEAV